MKRIHPTILSAFLMCSISSTSFAFSVKSADELDEVIQAANAGVTTLNDFLTKNKVVVASTRTDLTTQAVSLKTTNAAITSLIESLKAADANRNAFRKDARDRAAAEAIEALKVADQKREAAENENFVANLESANKAVPFVASQKAAVSLTKALEGEFAKLKEELASQQNAIEQQIKAIAENIDRIKAQLEKLEKILQAIDSLLPKLLAYMAQDSSAQQSKACMNHISEDRNYASKLLAAVRANLNNPDGLEQVLKNISPGSGIDVREVKEATGLIVIFRIGALNHCISTKQQCGGKAYSFTR